MTIDELRKKLHKIDTALFVDTGVTGEFLGVNWLGALQMYDLYDAEENRFREETCDNFLSKDQLNNFKTIISEYLNKKDNDFLARQYSCEQIVKGKQTMKFKNTKDVASVIKETQKDNQSMKDWSRVVIETEEPNPVPIAVVTNDNFEVADGLQIRLKPVYPDKAK